MGSLDWRIELEFVNLQLNEIISKSFERGIKKILQCIFTRIIVQKEKERKKEVDRSRSEEISTY